jgi:hypothetical protein
MTEELSLEKVDEKLLAKFSNDGTPMGLEEYKPAVEWGYFKLDNETGDIEYTLTGEKKKEWEIVIIDFSWSRILFPSSMSESEPICKTVESKKNPTDLEGTKYGRCVSCQYSQWIGNKRPECALSLNFHGLVGGEKAMPFSLQLKRSRVKKGEQLLNEFKRNNTPLFLKIMTLKASDIIKSGAVEYRVFEFEESRSVTEDEANIFAEIQAQGMRTNAETEESPVSAEKGAEILGGEIVEDKVEKKKKEQPNDLPFP